MSLVEKVRERVEEVRAKGPMTVLEEKFPKVKEIRGGSSILGGKSGGSSPQFPTIEEVRAKGILGVLEEKFPKVKEIRKRGILARPILGAREEGKKEIVVEEGPAITGRAAVRETRLSVEV